MSPSVIFLIWLVTSLYGAYLLYGLIQPQLLRLKHLTAFGHRSRFLRLRRVFWVVGWMAGSVVWSGMLAVTSFAFQSGSSLTCGLFLC